MQCMYQLPVCIESSLAQVTFVSWKHEFSVSLGRVFNYNVKMRFNDTSCFKFIFFGNLKFEILEYRNQFILRLRFKTLTAIIWYVKGLLILLFIRIWYHVDTFWFHVSSIEMILESFNKYINEINIKQQSNKWCRRQVIYYIWQKIYKTVQSFLSYHFSLFAEFMF